MSPRPLRILCATDLLPRSEAAVERAGLIADACRADLSLMHVVVPAASEQILEETLQVAQTKLRERASRPSWRHHRLPGTAIRVGGPARQVADEVANGAGADLLVLGPHRRRPVRDALEGTIAERALSLRSCGVLIVAGGEVKPYRRVMLAVDDRPSSAAAIRAAEGLVLSGAEAPTVVYANEPPYRGMLDYANVTETQMAEYARHWHREAARRMRSFVQREATHPERFAVHVVESSPVGGILRAVEQMAPDLLVIGTRGGGRLHRALLGSTANRVLHEVSCDVLVAPLGSFQVSAMAGREVPSRHTAPGSRTPAHLPPAAGHRI